MEDWINHEFLELDFGDKRVEKSGKRIINTLSKQPGASIPKAFNTGSEVKACYEFFHSGKVTPERILKPQQQATLERIKGEAVILLPQDTSALNYSSKPSIRDLGNIGGPKNQGIFVHPLLAITPTRINLGIVDAKIWIREEKNTQLTDHQIYALPLEEKEKFRWVESYRVGCQVAQNCPNTQVIVMTDREGDFAELFE
ncbi:MAG: transposase DNA-binding-containing protein, partial [Chlamydiales bacterium]